MKWISVKERMPEEDIDVLVITDRNEYEVGRVVNKIYDSCGRECDPCEEWYVDDIYGTITHWMPLPPKPD